MDYEWLSLLKAFIGAFACCVSIFLSGKVLVKRKFKEIRIYNYLLLVPIAIFLILNSYVFDNVLKIFGTLSVFFCIYKFSLKTKLKESLLYSIIACIVYLLGEAIFVLLVSLIDLVFKTKIAAGFVQEYIANIFFSIISFLFMYLLRKVIAKNVNKLNKNHLLFPVILGFVTIFVALSSIYKLYLNEWKINYAFILNMIIIVGCICIFFILLKQHLKTKEITDKYFLLEDYLKTSADLIEKYSSTIHKYKNNLITIKGYMKSDLKEANEYIDGLLESYKSKKYNWFSKINYIKFDSIRYLIYYKLSKAEEEDLKISVDVSNEIKEINNNFMTKHETNTLLEILGEYFDNAIYASRESKEKEMNFIMYKEEEKIVFTIANTYKEKIDLSMITKNGYTTKGKGHGLGLYDVDKSIKTISSISNKYEIVDNYFVTTLIYNITKDDKNKK